MSIDGLGKLEFFSKLIEWIEKHSQPCFYKEHFGFECPGCGFQRAFIELLKGNIWESFKLYPALIPIIFLIVLLLLHLKIRYKHGAIFIKLWFIFTIALLVGNYIFKLIIN